MRNLTQKLLPLLLVACAAVPTAAAEVRVRSEADCQGAIVLLGDIAEIHANDESRGEELAAIELFPAPPRGSVRQLPLRELQELLYLRGVDVSDCRFFGATATTIVAGGAVEPGELPPAGDTLRSTAEARLSEAISSYLGVVASDDYPDAEWQVRLNIAAQYAGHFANRDTQILVQGGESPWRGRQSFKITLLHGIGAAEVGTQEFTIDADVRAMTRVVVATQSLSRGRQVAAADVQLASYEAGGASGLLISPEEAVGLELANNIQAGRPIRAADLRAPRLVLRNDRVQLVVQSEGIVVRTAAQALDDGALGDWIEVRSLNGRDRFTGRVIAPGIVELGAAIETTQR